MEVIVKILGLANVKTESAFDANGQEKIGDAIRSQGRVMNQNHLRYNCAGMPRRDFLQLCIGAVLGLGFSDVLRLQARGAAAGVGSEPSALAATKRVNCIMIWLDGGPSHYETFDPKPDAPSEIRGDFKAIPTSVPGGYFSEVLPNLAKAANKLTVVRSICHND